MAAPDHLNQFSFLKLCIYISPPVAIRSAKFGGCSPCKVALVVWWPALISGFLDGTKPDLVRHMPRIPSITAHCDLRSDLGAHQPAHSPHPKATSLWSPTLAGEIPMIVKERETVFRLDGLILNH